MFVIVPQATRRLLPPLIGLLVNIVQNTTIAGLIGVGDVLETGTRSTERLLFSTGDAHASIYLSSWPSSSRCRTRSRGWRRSSRSGCAA